MTAQKRNDLLYTVIGVLIMIPIMTIFNKYLAYSACMEYPLTTPSFWLSVLIGFFQRLPVVFLLQFFVVQPFAERKSAEHTRPDDSWIVKAMIRTGFSIIILCPVLSLYANLLLVLEGHITSVPAFLNNWLPKMVVNWVFAYFVQVFAAGPLNRAVFLAVVKRRRARA